MRRTTIVLTLLAIALPQAAWTQEALVRKGQDVYAKQQCAMCHSVAGKGNPKGALDGVGSKWTAAEIREWIVNWKEMATKHNATRKPPMKDYSALAKADVDALVAYLQTLKQPSAKTESGR
jgi:mono/diheme cytochrome c family protein